jgi:iron complex outermembrane receptor protein
LASTLLIGAAVFATPAFAQDATNTPRAQSTSPVPGQEDETQSPTPVTNTNAGTDTDEEIVVTGTLFRTTTSATVSPVTVISAESMDQRGQNTVQDAIQALSSNNGPALTNSFTANGAFASGASAVSLRGLSTNSTLVLFDGQRAAYYPLADDGSRNFVDLNTIPDDIVDRIEVLRDGASSTYGADAIAGVVNIITRRQFNGVSARAEAGISQDGNNPTQRLSLTAGTGDLDANGFNAYVSGFYYRQGVTYARDLDSPFNNFDETDVCFEGVCGNNNITNATRPLTAFGIGYDVFVAPRAINSTGTGDTAVAGDPGRFQLLNPTAGCRYGPGYASTAAERAAAATVPFFVCTTDAIESYQVTSPAIERFGGSFRITTRLGEQTEGYFMTNFQQNTVSYTGFPVNIRAAANAGIVFRPFSTASGPSPTLAPGSAELRLPVYVCPGGVASANGLGTGCTATSPGAQLNPNNPFAAQGQLARILGRPFSTPTDNQTRSRVYRAAAGITTTLWDDWDLRVDATAMHNDLRRTQNNYIHIGNFLTAIAQGTINLVNPGQNTQQQLDFIMPQNVNDLSSDLYALQATVGTELFELPGGPVQLGFGGQIRYEAVDSPSGNPDYNGPTDRYFVLNAFGTSGSRWVYSGFAELNAPVLDILEFNLSGRYDDYSSGQNAFSPKVGVKFTPIPQIALRATWSRGFRIPAFGEANALPTTGYVSTNATNFNNAYLATYTVPGNTAGPGGTFAQCSAATFSTAACPTYIRANSYGQTTLASPNLDPERSRSFTVGAIFNPIRNFTVTVDYYDIKKTGAITQPSNAPALAAYYAGQPIPPGYNVIPSAPDPNFPTNRPVIGFIEAQLVNANTIRARGIDFAAIARLNLGGVRLTSSVEASYILELSTTFPGGTTENYEGTIGNYNLTAGTGTPRWNGSWQNTLDFGTVSFTGTANYRGGYNLSAEDQGGVSGDCGLGAPYAPCDVDEYITFDLVTQVEVNDRFTFYLNVLNLLDELPPVDVATYGAFLYNPVQAGNGIFGRQFRAGVRVNF